MKKSAVLTVCISIIMLSGCGAKTAGTVVPAIDTGASFTIKVGDSWSRSHPFAAALDEVFVPEVAEKTGGSVNVEVYHDGIFGNEQELWESVRGGTVEAAVIGTPMNREFSTMLISDWPFLYRDIPHAEKVWTGGIADEINLSFHETFPEVQILAWGPNSARTFTSNKPLTCEADFSGQRFRMPNNPIHIGIAENLGAKAFVIPLNELAYALEHGVVDGQDNGMVTVRSEKLYENQKYLYETNHIISTLELVVNSEFMERLSESQRGAVLQAAKDTARSAWDGYIAGINADREFLIGKGMTVTPCTDAEREKIKAKLAPLYEKLYAEVDSAKALADEISNVR